ncbi:kinesin-like protein KIF14 [Apodemus sylvaticus]|uniref:kinesin-like protein KIF14 n=1 Tax=Apodemus sylvaticus TaxID=10129 RepID=UPI002242884B|nr:kinesin-like protein KIF14 [Apodemus sylvaticus]XP_052055962.1 kinesin-like protein KIF14 [Apodemus sylvaticus]
MSVHTSHSRHNIGSLEVSSSQKISASSGFIHNSRLELHLKSEVSECENHDPLANARSKTIDINSTYVISACKKTREPPVTPDPGRLTLQRRTSWNKESSSLGSELGDTSRRAADASLRLQRRHARADCVEKRETLTPVGGDPGSTSASREARTGTKLVNNDTRDLSSGVSVKDSNDTWLTDCKDPCPALSAANEKVTVKKPDSRAPVGSQRQREAVRSGLSVVKPPESKPDTQGSGGGNSHHGNAGKDTAKHGSTFGSSGARTPAKCVLEHRLAPRRDLPPPKSPALSTLRNNGRDIANHISVLRGLVSETSTPVKRVPEHRSTPRRDLPPPKSPALSTLKHRIASPRVKPRLKSSLFANKRESSQEDTLPPEEKSTAQNTFTEPGSLKVENSQVTVAVRVRPFSKREKTEKASQVVFTNGEEITVEHPDMKQMYSFIYDVLFWSFDDCHPGYASQTTVYETLAAPLLDRAFEGYNTCLFAYGQTGSGKSYTMMGLNEEPGIIPRFCEDLFAQIAKKQTSEVTYHLEMSFFEVYNEKIHDLLVCKGENGQRKQPLRVREHPVSGPYVEGLSTNVVSSYSDIQSWLELGNKQRATAATGMNDRSSRSHSVVTLVMTQTKTELVEGEEHDHRITSRINLIDLAGSERCATAHSSGERLKEGVSINKSLLTLGKVISALSEQAHGKRVFIPYRESTLTWLLKESLGGNSKTAMIATISPAANNIEETLSTLRYATQARLIVNVAKVNEDMNAKLIRELKAEIEKLKAVQRNSQNIDPERYRLCRQEITSLRMKLHQQERDMAEIHRVWKEKFEQAEKRKLQETKELQKAGVTFQMDNHLPNLVNLNEDPQLSEMLLYMVKEGVTTVGKRAPSSSRDIQLSGVLIADDHCTIRNFGGTVSIVPAGEAKTFVNGMHILEPTVLHHGDRVVLGGDHYFRFNHPVEVQKGKKTSSRNNLTSEGPKDFEFAKNELLTAQRSRLEAEIKDAQLKAKEEMMQGIQVAKEMAQQELSSQKAAYESKIQALEAELREESQRKRLEEINNQKASHKIEELERAKQYLEQEVYVNKRRLEMETLATKQALEDHRIRHAKILEALEIEKQKIVEEVQMLQESRGNRDKTFTIQPNWSSLKLSMMIQEANAINDKFKRCYVFGRHDASDKGRSDTSVRVRNLQLGISTFWSLEKFESKLAAMKELYESNGGNRGEDVFCDPEDEWEPDITSTPVSSLSRRRSRSLMKNRRVSGCLHDIHPIPSTQSSHSSGLVDKPSTIYSNPSESFLPGICKELIGSSIDFLGQSFDEEKTIADSLINNLLKIYNGVIAISKAHEEQDEESQDNLFSSDRAAQALTVQVACAFEQLVVLFKHWLGDFPPCTRLARLEDELRQDIKKLGGYLQLFLQGCCSDISSMVKEAQNQVLEITQQAVRCVGQLAVLKGSKLCVLENSSKVSSAQEFMAALQDGVALGMKSLLDCGLEAVQELRQALSRQCAQEEVAKQMKANAVGLVGALENAFTTWRTKSFRTQVQEGSRQQGSKMLTFASEFLKLKSCLQQTVEMTVSALRGHPSDLHCLRSCADTICSLARKLHGDFGALSASAGSCGSEAPRADCEELESLAQSLLRCFEREESPGLLKAWDSCSANSKEEQHQSGGAECSRSEPRPAAQELQELHELHEDAAPAVSPGDCAPNRIQWV